MDAREAVAEIRRRKAALNRVEAILTDCTGNELELLIRIFATCSAYEIAALRDALLQPGGQIPDVGKHEQRNTTEQPPPDPAPNTETLVQQVEDAIKHFDLITSPKILGYLKQRGVTFSNHKPVAGISAILRKLVFRERLTIVEMGTHNKPTVFRKSGVGGAKPT